MGVENTFTAVTAAAAAAASTSSRMGAPPAYPFAYAWEHVRGTHDHPTLVLLVAILHSLVTAQIVLTQAPRPQSALHALLQHMTLGLGGSMATTFLLARPWPLLSNPMVLIVYLLGPALALLVHRAARHVRMPGSDVDATSAADATGTTTSEAAATAADATGAALPDAPYPEPLLGLVPRPLALSVDAFVRAAAADNMILAARARGLPLLSQMLLGMTASCAGGLVFWWVWRGAPGRSLGPAAQVMAAATALSACFHTLVSASPDALTRQGIAARLPIPPALAAGVHALLVTIRAVSPRDFAVMLTALAVAGFHYTQPLAAAVPRNPKDALAAVTKKVRAPRSPDRILTPAEIASARRPSRAPRVLRLARAGPASESDSSTAHDATTPEAPVAGSRAGRYRAGGKFPRRLDDSGDDEYSELPRVIATPTRRRRAAAAAAAAAAATSTETQTEADPLMSLSSASSTRRRTRSRGR
ncbi:hypothetical protein CXG81DRAFT_25117 [Caulochytrium protostelioides]|uniref:Uncharacterized protein n=1 Tax=Caulochytrium protostelioides TaxID=1555241 RepID=A0A4P9XA57_9FUNG|nr:hypothetical protein CXG81DRAFT_25117 [Caulochytrium protostelioides]|eukprot:RKP02254.1 hypothetical protein CXG81DRAFT_25117 [Caulochytrium protostelioides]